MSMTVSLAGVILARARSTAPGGAAWKVTVAVARTASPATSPLEASTPLGTSQAITGRAPRDG